MVQCDTRPNTPINFSEMMGDDLDLDDLEEITFDEIEQLLDDSGDEEEDGAGADSDESNQVDDAVTTFKGHTGSVFCCHISPHDASLAVSGGEDEKVFFWNAEDGSVVHEAIGFKDSVIGVEFNHDGKYVAAGDMGGIIKVWKIVGGSPQEIWADNFDEIMWLKWHHKANVLLCGVNSGEVFIWKIPSGDCRILAGHGVASDIGVFMPDGKRAVIGYKDSLVKVFDLVSCKPACIVENPELNCILCVSCHLDNNLVAAGTINSKIVIFSSQNGKVLSLFTCFENREEQRDSVESIAFSKEPSLPYLAAGTTSEVVIWDYSKQIIRNRLLIDEGITRLVWDQQGPLVYIGTQEGDVKVMDARSGTIEVSLRGHTSAILDLGFSKDGKKLITASDDKTLKIFSIGPGLST